MGRLDDINIHSVLNNAKLTIAHICPSHTENFLKEKKCMSGFESIPPTNKKYILLIFFKHYVPLKGLYSRFELKAICIQN